MKLCKDCKYSSNDTKYSICQRTIKPIKSPVDGSVDVSDKWYSVWSRNSSWLEVFLFKTCGKAGKYWEAK